jgi:hypothetical protein
MRALILSIVMAGSVLIVGGNTFATDEKVAGGKTGSKNRATEDKERGHEGGRDRGHGGVGVNVDLGGIGQRRSEADPFAVSGGSSVSQSQEKPKTKAKQADVTTSNAFTDVKLTGSQAKEVASSESSSATLPKK